MQPELSAIIGILTMIKEGIHLAKEFKQRKIELFIEASHILIGRTSFLVFLTIANNAEKPCTVIRMNISLGDERFIERIPLLELKPIDSIGKAVYAISNVFSDQFEMGDILDRFILPNQLYLQPGQAHAGWSLFVPRTDSPQIHFAELQIKMGSGEVITHSLLK